MAEMISWGIDRAFEEIKAIVPNNFYLTDTQFFIIWSFFFVLFFFLMVRYRIVHKKISIEDDTLKDMFSLGLTLFLADISAYIFVGFMPVVIGLLVYIFPFPYPILNLILADVFMSIPLIYSIKKFIGILKNRRLYPESNV